MEIILNIFIIWKEQFFKVLMNSWKKNPAELRKYIKTSDMFIHYYIQYMCL